MYFYLARDDVFLFGSHNRKSLRNPVVLLKVGKEEAKEIHPNLFLNVKSFYHTLKFSQMKTLKE
jgi:hypothetical protein